MCKGLNSEHIVSEIDGGTRDISSYNRAHGVGYIDRVTVNVGRMPEHVAMCS